MFKDIVKRLMNLNFVVTLESNNYIVREVNLNEIVEQISCCDKKKEQKLLHCYNKLIKDSLN